MACYKLHTVPRHGRQRTGSIALFAKGLRQALRLASHLVGDGPVELGQSEGRVCRLLRSSPRTDDFAFWMVS
jgi:hypothetical protein